MSKYTDAVESGLRGLEAVSTGLCPGCDDCADAFGYESTEAFTADYETGQVYDEGHFSWNGCGICGSSLDGTLEHWHAIDKETKRIVHFDDACMDCVLYIANGDEPDERDATSV